MINSFVDAELIGCVIMKRFPFGPVSNKSQGTTRRYRNVQKSCETPKYMPVKSLKVMCDRNEKGILREFFGDRCY